MLGWWVDLVQKGACYLVWEYELNSWNLYGGRKELTIARCPVTSASTLWHTCPITHIKQMKTNVNFLKIKMWKWHFTKSIAAFFSSKSYKTILFWNNTFCEYSSDLKNMYLTQVSWHKPVTPALRRQREMNYEFKASLSYIKPCLKWKERSEFIIGSHGRLRARCFLRISLHKD